MTELDTSFESDEVVPSLSVTLVIHPSELNCGGDYIYTSFKRAELNVLCEGFSVTTGTKHGERKTPERYEVTQSSEISQEKLEQRDRRFKVRGKLDVPLVNPSFSSGGEAEWDNHKSNKNNSSTKENLVKEIFPVKAIGDDTWLIRERDNTELSATYLDNQRLCDLQPKLGANRQSITTTVSVKQKYLETDGNLGFSKIFKNSNKSKVLKVLIAKGLHEVTAEKGGQYQGELILASVEHTPDE